MRRAAKVDRNQAEIVSALRKVGCSVQPLHTIGGGCPDLLVARHYFTLVMEVKDGKQPLSKRRLTPDEQKWKDNWQGAYQIVCSVDDALRVVGAIR